MRAAIPTAKGVGDACGDVRRMNRAHQSSSNHCSGPVRCVMHPMDTSDKLINIGSLFKELWLVYYNISNTLNNSRIIIFNNMFFRRQDARILTSKTVSYFDPGGFWTRLG